MELSPRKRAVLAAIIKAYIETGEPVGSKNLAGLMENAPSSATLRNEMSELCELGFLEQPHTSAGRVPTNLGYRLYVEHLMKPPQLNKTIKEFIDKRLDEANCDPEQLPREAGNILSDLTGLPAISLYVADGGVSLKRLEMIKFSSRSAMLMLITSDGRSRNRIFRYGSGFTPELRNRFFEIVEKRIRGKPISELNRAYMQTIVAEAGIDLLKLLPLFTLIFDMSCEIEAQAVDLSGEALLYNVCGNADAARKIISLIERQDPFISIFEKISDKVTVIFGNDTDYRELEVAAFIAARFSSGSNYRGAVGVIAPKRVSYDQVIPSIEYLASKLTGIMTEAMKDMED